MNFLRQNFYQAGWQVLSVVQRMVSGTPKGSVIGTTTTLDVIYHDLVVFDATTLTILLFRNTTCAHFLCLI